MTCHEVPSMGLTNALLTASASAIQAVAPVEESEAGAALALFLLIVMVASWLALRTFVRSLRAGKAQRAVGESFADYALQALVNAAKIDGRINDQERAAIVGAMSELGGPVYTSKVLEAAFAKASLSKDELVAYLASRSTTVSREQKVALLKALLSVFVADSHFDEREHAALVDYTEAVGFDRQAAPDLLRRLSRGNIT